MGPSTKTHWLAGDVSLRCVVVIDGRYGHRTCDNLLVKERNSQSEAAFFNAIADCWIQRAP